MAIARPMSAARNLTMTDTSVATASGQMSRKVVGIATIAMSSGTIAIHEANTKARTRSAPAPGDQGLDDDARATVLRPVGRCRAQRVEPGDVHRGPLHGDAGQGLLRRARLGLPGVHAAERRDGDERERRAPVRGHEGPVVRRRVGGDAGVGQRGLDLRHRRLQLPGDAGCVDGRAPGQRHDRHDRSDVSAVAVDRCDAAVGDGRLASRDVERRRQRVPGGLHRREPADRQDDPESDDELLVSQHPPGEGGHRVVVGHRGVLSLRTYVVSVAASLTLTL